MHFVRGFEVAIFVAGALIFLHMAVATMLRKAKRLPAGYELKVIDLYGNQVSVDGHRKNFSTSEAAESFARFYAASYAGEYRFKVVGIPQ